ncbi:MAG TPA: divergent polysaccharide deacetylase family protein [bacterium]|nr:divergent polysaccharide deacetylase family protein [bacterium]HPN32124.1 divergent polysaccharide deacetylase family protein [bacterium]
MKNKAGNLITVLVAIILIGVFFYHIRTSIKKKSRSGIKNEITETDTQTLSPRFEHQQEKIADDTDANINAKIIKPMNQSNSGMPALNIVIDDIGGNLKLLKEFLRIDADLNFAVMPDLQYTDKSMELIYQSNKTLLLHLPIEPEDSKQMKNPADFILTSMTDSQIQNKIGEYMNKYEFIDGINNHMGSKGTADSRIMNSLTLKIKSFNEQTKKNIFFLDSRTTSKSQAYFFAKKNGIRAIMNQGFLDNQDNVEKIFDRIKFFSEKAIVDNKTITLIGHLRPLTLEAIKRFILSDMFLSGQIEFTSCKDLLTEPAL